MTPSPHSVSTPGEERRLLLEPLRERVPEIPEFLRGSNMTPRPLHEDTRHLDELQRTLAILEGLAQVENLSPHHAHLLLKHQSVEALVSLEQIEQVITDILDEVHVAELVQHQV